MTTSLIISTYNRPDALEVCLKSIRELNKMPDEVIIGDDGSRPDTEALVKKYLSDFPVRIVYIWQEDEGFRLAMIRNKCVAAATGEYIIQIDGDLYLHPDFISDHIREAREGYFLKGGRVKLGKELTHKICTNREPVKITPFTKGIESKRLNSLHMPIVADYLAPRYRKNKNNVLGCNMSFFRKDFIAINGYDEEFEGWGGEDLDMSFRFRNLGLGKRYLKFCALTYHLWHNEAPTDKSAENHAMAHSHHTSGTIKATKGVMQYLK